MTKREYVSMRGKVIDLELLKKMNELVPAVGNAKLNARGDEIGPGGKIVRKREDIIKDYYKNNPNRVMQETTTKPEKKQQAETAVPTASVPIEEKNVVEDEEWIEDSTGNFVKKEKSGRKPKQE